MKPAFKKQKIFFETRVHLGRDMSLIETFHDGSQLIYSRNLMIIIKAQSAIITHKRIKAEIALFSKN